MNVEADPAPPAVTSPPNQGARASLIGKIAGATAFLVALGGLLDAAIAIATKGKTLTCNLVVSFPWCPSPVEKVSLPSGTSLTCKYTSGPKAGQTQNFDGVPGIVPVPIGAPCTDAQGSLGIAIAGDAKSLPTRMSLICKYTAGPKAGQTQNFAGVPGITPAPVGAPCTDGQGSSGVAE
jgi:hypothetical protein